ncbi:MAG TPA: AraC family transcriptional regulator [Polyangiaceae bacterium]
MRSPGTVAAAFLRALLDRAAGAGVDPSSILDAIGVSRETLADVNGWIPVKAMADAWALVSERAADPDFGLHAAESLPIGVYGVLEFATMSSPNIGATLELVARYYRLMGAMSELRLETGRDAARVTLRPAVAFEVARLRHYHEYTLAFLVTRGRMAGGEAVVPAEVRFMHAAPPSTAEHARIFRSPVLFGQTENVLLVSRAVLDIPLRTADEASFANLQRAGETMMEAPTEEMLPHVREVTRAALDAGDARLEIVARRLGVGARTLQRRLGEHGTTYARLLDEVRRETAERWVEQGTRSFGEIAFGLGFSEPSAFHRAFKRWTGRTPREYKTSPR